MITDEMVAAAEAAYGRMRRQVLGYEAWVDNTVDEQTHTAKLKCARAALEAVAPMIRNATLEEAAKVLEEKFNKHGWDYHLPSVGREAAAAIRALATPETGEKS